MLILGVDPGSRITGIGLVHHARAPRFEAAGTIQLPAQKPLSDRLLQLHSELCSLFKNNTIQLMVLEKSFVHLNPHTAMTLGHVRGVCLLCAKLFDVSILEISPAALKRHIASKGNASKRDMQLAVSRLLSLDAMPSSDAADALALAIHGSYTLS